MLQRLKTLATEGSQEVCQQDPGEKFSRVTGAAMETIVSLQGVKG